MTTLSVARHGRKMHSARHRLSAGRDPSTAAAEPAILSPVDAWREKLDASLLPRQEMPELVGVLACGSFITGRPNPNSDLDVHLVLADAMSWRERGNRIVDGLLIVEQ